MLKKTNQKTIDSSLTVDFVEEQDTNDWIFSIKRNGSLDKIISVEFEIENKCISKPYQILYPVDEACDEQGEYITELEIVRVGLQLIDKDGDCYDYADYDLELDEKKIIEQIIESDYEF